MTDVDFGRVAPETRRKLESRLAEAAHAFASERFGDALTTLQSVDRLAPDVVEVLELRGLCNYRLGKWEVAVRDLEKFRQATSSVEQHPVLADCYRALGRHDDVERLWWELGDASPHPALVEEGRIVYAGSMADQGKLSQAITTLEKAPDVGREPGVHHLRRWYALADLYERAGERTTARKLFTSIVAADAQFGDAAERAANLA